MGLISRMIALIRAKMSQLLEGAEDPGTALDYSYQRQLQLLQDVKRGVVEVTTSRRRLDLQAGKLRENVEKLDGQARTALEQKREDLARLALQRKQAAQMQLNDLDTQIASLDQEQAKLQDAEMRLRTKVESFRTRKETIKAQYSAAEAQVRIGEAATGLSEEMADIGLAIERAEQKTEQMKARSLAIDELVQIGTLDDHIGGDMLDRELAQLTAGSDIDHELANMKRQIAAPKSTPQLTTGEEEEVKE
ncbi:MAG: PspA/IM30 family protein [Ardenticatenales bacterium]|nr:PspA/IM30 family protein [Ardenticatenales bacterium]